MDLGNLIAKKVVDRAVNKAKEAGINTAKIDDQARTKLHRKYVWRDFSVGLEKAKIKILQCEGKDLIAQDLTKAKFEYICTLSVQINPSGFKSYYYRPAKSVTSGLEVKGDKENNIPAMALDSGHTTSEFDPQLYYDIYDEFMARTADESYPSHSFSLMDDKVTSLPMLYKYATTGIYYALFEWGDIRKFGLLHGVEVDYSAFSRWGQPLKATATLHIAEQPLQDGQPVIKPDIDSITDKAGEIGEVVGNVAAGIKNIFR